MKIDEVIDTLQKYRDEYGNIPVAFISNSGEKSEINTIDVIGISDDEDFEHEEEVAIFIDKFDYENEQDMDYVNYDIEEPDEDYLDSGCPIEDPDYDDYWDSGCPIEDKEDWENGYPGYEITEKEIPFPGKPTDPHDPYWNTHDKDNYVDEDTIDTLRDLM